MQYTFFFRFTEYGVVFINGHQSNIFVVYDVLRVFKAIMSEQKVINGYLSEGTKLVGKHNIKDLC